MAKIILAFLLMAPLLQADSLGLLRRWAVFPFEAETELTNAAQAAWWKGREMLTQKKKYLVASRQFLEQKEAYRPRKELRVDDVKVLANLLEADVLVTGYNKGRNFTLNAYLASNGVLFWTKSMTFHPSLKASDQLELVSENLFRELIASIPYDGFTINDPLIGKTVYEADGKVLVLVDFGKGEVVDVGTDVQWIEVNVPGDLANAPALSKSTMALVAEGHVISVKQGIATVELLRKDPNKNIVEAMLVRFTKARIFPDLPSEYDAKRDVKPLAPELLPSQINPLPDTIGEKKKPGFFLGSGLGILGIILLAL